MTRDVIFRAAAVEDLVAAAAWYETHAAGLGEDLIDEVVAAVRRAQGNPELFRVVLRESEVRRVLPQRFPYRIFFSVVGDTLYVHAVLHGAWHDHRWRERL
jgi:toxin ParE1/3/4